MRSKLLFIAAILAFLAGSAKAQTPQISINHYLETTGEVVIPVYITNVNNVGGITLNIHYNNDALEYIQHQNMTVTEGSLIVNNTTVNNEENTSSINLAWLTTDTLTSININGMFLEFVFYFSGDYSDFEFFNVEFVDNSIMPSPFPVGVSNGSITYQQPVGVAIGEVYNPPPGTVDIPIFVDFSAVEAGVGAFDFLIEYDHNVLSEPGLSDEEVAGIALTELEPGQIRLQWENTSPPGSQLNGKLLNLKFEIIEDGESELSFIKDSSSMANQDGINLPVHFVDGFVGLIDVYDITFIVKDGLGGAVNNATILLGDVENPPGDYFFADVHAITHSYSVTAPGFSEATGTIEVDQDITINVTIDDIEAPQIECPADLINIPAGESECFVTIINIGEPTVSDNHTPVGELDITNDAPENHLYPVGETIITWTVTDAAGNTATCTQTITVVDNEPPQIACPPHLPEVATDEGECYATITDIGAPDVSDNCTPSEDLVITNDAPKNNQYPVGTTIITWTVTDAAGNTATCTQTITVVDDEAPVPPTETLENITVHDNDIVCFNATQTIITAGNDAYFIVEDGGSATLIAGQTIRMLPGTVVKHGGYLHARITLDDEYCGAPVAKLLDEPAAEPPAETLMPVNPNQDALFKVYPNPTTGAFTLELTDVSADKQVTVEVYGLRGEIILSEVIPPMQKHHFDLENQIPGLYIIRVTAGERTDYQRIIIR